MKKNKNISKVIEGDINPPLAEQLLELSTVLDIKENIISELRSTIDNYCEQLVLRQPLQMTSVPVLTQATVQLFWATDDLNFSEEKSVSHNLLLSNLPTEIIFSLPENLNNIKQFRFDIGNEIGLLNIHDVEIKRNNENVIWKWDKKTVFYKNGLLLIENNVCWPDKIVHLALSSDPHFTVLNSSSSDGNDGVFTVHILISAVEYKQFDLIFSTINTPLTYSPIKEINEFNKITDLLTHENTALLAEITVTRSYIQSINEEKIALARRADNNEQLVQNLNTDKADLNSLNILLRGQIAQFNEVLKQQEFLFAKQITSLEECIRQLTDDKSILMKEVDLKNNIVDKLFSEKEQLEKGLEEKEIQLKDTLSANNHLQNELLIKKDELTRSKEEILDIENKFNFKGEQYAILLSEKRKKEGEIGTLNDYISTITQQNGDLIKQSDEQQTKLERLNHDYSFLIKHSTNVEGELNRISKEKEALVASVEKLNQQLEYYVENYAKKNILQIGLDKLTGKNMFQKTSQH